MPPPPPQSGRLGVGDVVGILVGVFVLLSCCGLLVLGPDGRRRIAACFCCRSPLEEETSRKRRSTSGSNTIALARRAEGLPQARHYAMPGRSVHSSYMAHWPSTEQLVHDVGRRSCYERARDSTFATLASPLFGQLAIVHFVLIVVFGAMFFLLLIGAHNVQAPQPYEDVYNASIQILNGLFTYGVIVTFPWRLANAFHLWWPNDKRPYLGGHDFYGRPTLALWFHIPWAPRSRIVLLLLSNTVFQLTNQAARIKYHSYRLADRGLGKFYVNFFFALAFASALLAAFLQWRCEEALRRRDPYRFPPPPMYVIRQAWKTWIHGGLTLRETICEIFEEFEHPDRKLNLGAGESHSTHSHHMAHPTLHAPANTPQQTHHSKHATANTPQQTYPSKHTTGFTPQLSHPMFSRG